MRLRREGMEGSQPMLSSNRIRVTICTPTKCKNSGSQCRLGQSAGGVLSSPSNLHEQCGECSWILSIWSHSRQLQILDYGDSGCGNWQQDWFVHVSHSVRSVDTAGHPCERLFLHSLGYVWAIFGITLVTRWTLPSSWPPWPRDHLSRKVVWIWGSDLENV